MNGEFCLSHFSLVSLGGELTILAESAAMNRTPVTGGTCKRHGRRPSLVSTSDHRPIMDNLRTSLKPRKIDQNDGQVQISADKAGNLL